HFFSAQADGQPWRGTAGGSHARPIRSNGQNRRRHEQCPEFRPDGSLTAVGDGARVLGVVAGISEEIDMSGGTRLVERALCLLLGVAAPVALLPVSPASAQVEPPGKYYQRWKFLHDQRAYPFAQIPAGARQAALRDYQQRFGTAPVTPAA